MMIPTRCLETSITKNQSAMRNIAEEQMSRALECLILKTKVLIFFEKLVLIWPKTLTHN